MALGLRVISEVGGRLMREWIIGTSGGMTQARELIHRRTVMTLSLFLVILGAWCFLVV